MDELANKRRGRPKGIAAKVAAETGLSIRTVQRVLAKDGERREAPEERKLRLFLTAFRNFATFCRDNDPNDIGQLHVSDEQAAKIREWNDTISDWLHRLNEGE